MTHDTLLIYAMVAAFLLNGDIEDRHINNIILAKWCHKKLIH